MSDDMKKKNRDEESLEEFLKKLSLYSENLEEEGIDAAIVEGESSLAKKDLEEKEEEAAQEDYIWKDIAPVPEIAGWSGDPDGAGTEAGKDQPGRQDAEGDPAKASGKPEVVHRSISSAEDLKKSPKESQAEGKDKKIDDCQERESGLEPAGLQAHQASLTETEAEDPKKSSKEEPEAHAKKEADKPESTAGAGKEEKSQPDGKEDKQLTSEERQGIEQRREKRAENTKKKKRRSYLTDFLIIVIIVLLVSFFIKAIVVQGVSMEPTLETSDYILISKQAYRFGSPKRGDIVVFPHDDGVNKKLYIKRVIGLPGDRIVIHEDRLWINGKEKQEEYIKEPVVIGDVNRVVPKGELFVMGDNRSNSSDSRMFGTVPVSEVTGKAFIRLYPFDQIKVFK